MRVRAVDKSPGKGQIVTSEGVTGKESWEYSGRVG